MGFFSAATTTTTTIIIIIIIRLSFFIFLIAHSAFTVNRGSYLPGFMSVDPTLPGGAERFSSAETLVHWLKSLPRSASARDNGRD